VPLIEQGKNGMNSRPNIERCPPSLPKGYFMWSNYADNSLGMGRFTSKMID
jgi:hypothetical protein